MFAPNEDQQPLFTLRGYPVFATYFIVLVYAATMIVATVAGPAAIGAAASMLGFASEQVHRGQVWRVLSYGLVNPPSISFVIDMIVIVWFGRELEKFFGRKAFLQFYGLLYLVTPVAFTALGLIRPMSLVGETGGFALFIAFATLYPGALMFLRFPAAAVAALLVALYSLLALYYRDLVGLLALWINVGFAFAFVRYAQGRIELPSFAMPGFGRRPKLRVLPSPQSRTRDVADVDSLTEMDAILDKIARSGMASLTAKERARLEKGREALLKKDRR